MSFGNKKEQMGKYKEIPFQHLAPIDTVNDKTTFDALDYALSQENIHNVALTGNYGSGKSSILESYIKQKNKCSFFKGLLNRLTKKNANFLKISLATFAIENETDDSEKQNEKLPQTTAQEIEKSILQQIFYRKSGRKFPYSHFSRIKKIGFLRKLLTEIVVLLLLFAPVYVIKNDLWKNITDPFFKDGLTFFFAVSFAIAFCMALYKIISLTYKFRLAKLSFQDAEIEFDENGRDESLLNKYLDELLYFFEVTNFNIVIFEDLDRFRNTEIFIKLRELNTLLNNYEKIHRRIVFVYALRDEVFKDSSRTKFFDFIIPVIPIINNQNSSDMLINQWSENKDSPLGKIDESFLQDISLFVDDMRLLKNSINEFKIYDQKVNADDYIENDIETEHRICRDRNKIFALILYKNLYPSDFALLAQNKGELYSIFQKKKDVVDAEIPKIENSITQLEKQIETIEKQITFDIKELRTIYIAEVFSKKPKNNNMYILNDISDFLSDEGFEKIHLGNSLPCGSYYGGRGSFNYDFFAIEKEVNSLYSYKEREDMLKKKINGELETLKRQIAEKRASMSNIRQMSIAEMLDEFSPEQFVADVKTINKDFVIYLLRYSYIDENYFEYISYFYANSLSVQEKQYLLLIKNKQQPNFDLLINNPNFGNISSRIKDVEWKLPAVLNYSMLFCVLTFDDIHIDDFLNALWNYKVFNRNNIFLSKFNGGTNIQSKLYRRLYDLFGKKSNWIDILFSNEEINVVYNFFLYVNFEKTEKDAIAFLTNDMSYLHRQDIDKNTVASIIRYYDLKFNLLDDSVKYPIYNIILDNNAYIISKQNFDIIIKNAFADAAKNPIMDYYTCVSKLQNKNIKANVDQNIQLFVNDIVLLADNSITESEEAFVELLNNNTLLTETKVELIEKNDCVISDITKIKLAEIKLADGNEKLVDIRNLLYKHKKISPAWSNVFENFRFNGNKLDTCLVDYLNDKQIVVELVKEKPLTEEELKNESGNYSIVSSFYDVISVSNVLSIDSFSKLMNVCPWHYDKMERYDIGSKEMDVLIGQKKITLTSENYLGIKQNHTDLLSKYIAVWFDDFVDNWSELKLAVTFDDMKLLLESVNLNKDQKSQLLSRDFSVWQGINQKEHLVWIGKTIIELNFSVQLKAPIAVVIRNLDNEDDLIKIIALQGRYLKEAEIKNVINNKMSDAYKSCIENNGKKRELENNSSNLLFMGILKEKGIISSFKENGDKIRVYQKRANA